MMMLYANKILKEIYGKNEIYLSTDSLERITIGKSCIETVATTLNPDFPIVLYVKLNKTGYRIELKPNKNFDTIAGFFEYIRDYNEIDFETKEVPIKKQEEEKEVSIEDLCKQVAELKEIIDTRLCKVNIGVPNYWTIINDKDNPIKNDNIT